jgi:PmbA protein
MLEKNKAEKIIREVIQKSSYKEVEAYLSGGKNHLTRFAQNRVHQNVVQKDYVLTVKVSDGSRSGIATCNIFDGDNLEYVVKKAEKILKHVREDEFYQPPQFPQKITYSKAQKYFEKTAELSPEERAQVVLKIVNQVEQEKIIASGTVVNGDAMLAYGSSAGSFCYDKWTFAHFTLTLTNKNDWTTYYSDSNNNFEELEIDAGVSQALKRLNWEKEPLVLNPGKYTVLLEPTAAKTFLSYLAAMGLGGLQFVEKRSFMKLGEKLTGDKITIVDDAYAPGINGLPFDYEGSPREKVVLIEKGRGKNVVHDLKTAKRMGVKTTGHALSPGSTVGPYPLNLRLEAGNQSYQELLAGIKRGILVSTFFYSNIVNRNETTITGMTRDGTFLIENGEIVAPVKNMRYNENILDAFARVRALGRDLKTFRGKTGITSTSVPAMVIEDFNFTGVSQL